MKNVYKESPIYYELIVKNLKVESMLLIKWGKKSLRMKNSKSNNYREMQLEIQRKLSVYHKVKL